jgi:hypothetical protein
MKNTKTDTRPADSAAATGCAATGPRLRCLAKDQNCFYGMYKGCTVSILRDHKSRPWTFLVSATNGRTLADGFTKEPMTLREAIVHAVKGAGLWEGK